MAKARKSSKRRTVSRRGTRASGSPARAASAQRSSGSRSSGRGAKRRRKARGKNGRYLKYLSEAGFYLFAGAIVFAAVIVHFTKDLPSTDGLWRASDAPRMTLVAEDGSPLAIHGRSVGAPARLAELPPYVSRAVLAVEDRNFYHHIGVNPVSVIRAALVNIKDGEVRQGGSTLTQQLAKNLFLTSDRTYRRKIQELILAFWLERRFSKDEILTLYLNRVYFGAGAYGVNAASYRYFGKPAKRLSLAESAILAGLLKAPSRYAPDRNPASAGQRARLVIDEMLEAGFITHEQAAIATRTPVMIGPSRFAGAPYFTDYALSEAREKAKGVDADLTIRTTFDAKLQDALENGVIAGAALSALDPEIEVAAVILDGEGRIRAMTGGRDYRLSQFNRAANAHRQPGSAFKPFVYLAAIEDGASPFDIINDAPVTIGKWAPNNYKHRYYGEVPLETALAHSLNAATVRLQEKTGRGAVRLAARRMGLTSPLSQGPALALGVDAVTPIELAGAYAPFANGGFRVIPHAVEAIDVTDGGKVWRNDASFQGAAAPPEAIRTMNDMLAGVVASGTGRAAALTRATARGKTGTTQNNRDAWFAGYAGGLVCVVWVGRDDYKPMGKITGGTAPAKIWHEIMERALNARQPMIAPLIAPQSSPDSEGEKRQTLGAL